MATPEETTEKVQQYVEDNIADFSQIAKDAVEGADEFLADLSQSIPRQPYYTQTPTFPVDIDIEDIDVDEPDRPNIDNLVDDAVIPTIGDIHIPDAPDYTDPTAPIIQDIELPNPINVEIIPFELDFPEDTIEDTDLLPFEYVEAEYISDFKEALTEKFLGDITEPNSGIPNDILLDFLEKDEARQAIILEEAIDSVLAEGMKLGYPIPTGNLNAQVDKVLSDDKIRRDDKSKDQAILEWEKTVENVKLAVGNAIKYDGMLMAHSDHVANRALDTSKSVVTLGIAAFNAQVDRFRVRLEAYKTGAQAYAERLRGELAKVEVYKAQMAGAKLEGDIQEQRVTIYTRQVEAISSLFNRYRTEVEAQRVKASIEAERLNAFRTRVTAQVDKVRALVATYEADTSRYNASIRNGEANAGIKIKQQELISRNAQAALSMAADNARSNLTAFIELARMNIQQSQGGAQVYTTMAAAALSSLNSVIQLGSTSAVTKTEKTE
ncbi:hypothetical protein KAR91_42195 [Candidatus Pacearchaeota archaeon]|nr:hypothetical protein [Candidatus Pacearchaeota archaeon]